MSCTICWEDIAEEKKQVLRCNHAFHTGCINQWLNNNVTCPNCRANVRVTDADVPIETLRDLLSLYESYLEINIMTYDRLTVNHPYDLESIQSAANHITSLTNNIRNTNRQIEMYYVNNNLVQISCCLFCRVHCDSLFCSDECRFTYEQLP